jgi:hypothetical protein
MAKNLLWPFVVIAGLSLANASEAALGWTLAECKAHWGQPIAAPTSTHGQKQADFAAHQYRITVWLTGGTVVRVAYQPQYSTLSEPDLNKLLAANRIGSYAEWKYTGSDEPTQDHRWTLQQTDDTCLAYAVYVVKRNWFIVYTKEDAERADAENSIDAGGL